MKIQIIVFLLCIPFLGQAQEDDIAAIQYQQKSPKLFDLDGDFALLKNIRLVESVVSRWTFLGGDLYFGQVNSEAEDQCSIVPEECSFTALNELRFRYKIQTILPFKSDDQPPLKVEGMIAMMLQVIREESAKPPLWIFPFDGQVHRWSKEFLEEQNILSNPELALPKILYALAFGASSRFLVTGKESLLIREILKQPEDSINIEKMFRMSFIINKGDVYSTLMTIENVLSKHFLHRERELLPITRRLKSFIRGRGLDDDRFGNWYHLFGIMVYSYATIYGPIWSDSGLIAQLENLGGLFFNGGRTKQKWWVNKQGAEIGEKLKLAMQKREWDIGESDPSKLSEEKYLNIEDSQN